jgi:hypothetical protein
MRAATLLLAFLAALSAAARDLGTMHVSGTMAIEWTAIEPGEDGGFTARYRVRGSIDDNDGTGHEALLAGFDLSCNGTMQVDGGAVISDEAGCRVVNDFGDGLWLDISTGAAPWSWHRLNLAFAGGSGLYARLRGEGEVTRVMHTEPGAATPWGTFNGRVRWRLD